MRRYLPFLLFAFSVTTLWAQPANDLCSAAQSVTPNGTCYGGTTTGAADNWIGTIGCAGNHVDTWYTFTATNSQLAISITNGTQTGNIEFTLVESSSPPCAGLSLAGSSCGASPLTDTINGLQAGSTYYFTISSTGATGTYTVCVNNIAPTPVAGQDCNNAAILCDTTSIIQPTSNAGFGVQEVNTTNSCWGIGGERQSKWFKFSVGCDGTLEFNINPVNAGDDYDWAIWDITSDPTGCTTKGNSIACNWSACKPSTGLSSCPASEPGYNTCGAASGGDPCPNGNIPRGWYNWGPGANGKPCLGTTPISVSCGHVYALLVDNFSSTNNGFKLSFGGACDGGTALIGPQATFSVSSSNCNSTVTATKLCCTSTNFSYLWNFGDGYTSTSPGPVTHTYTTAGTYIISLTVTDPLGCQKFSSITISQTAITSTMAQSNVSCNGGTNGTATVTPTAGSSPYTYSWNPGGQTSSAATGLASGIYTVTISDANGCTGTKTVSISQPSVLTNSASVTSNVSCNGGINGSATITAGGGSPSYTYSWSPSGQTTATATGLTSGTYTAIVTDAQGCTKSASIAITQPTSITATTSSTNANCSSSNGTASVAVSGGTPSYSYSWNNGQTTSTATGLGAGSYTITITDNNGCTSTAISNVSNAGSPTVAITSTVNVSCYGGNNGSATVSATGGSLPYTYSWCNGQTTTIATGLSAGNCNVTITDNGGCVSVTGVTITEPTSLSAAISSSSVSCNGGNNGTATVIAGGGTPSYTYSWNNSQTTTVATGLASGTYTINITDANSCTTSGTVTVTQPTAVTATVSAQTDVSCNGNADGSVSVSGSGGSPAYTYVWNNGQSSATATGLISGNYTLTVTDANACPGTLTVSVTQPAVLTNSLTTVNVTCNGNSDGSSSVSVSGGTSPYTYYWSPTLGTASSATGLSAGNYSVTITDANGCTTTNSVTITEPAILTVSCTTTPSGCAAATGMASAFPSGGNPAFSYSWNNGQTTSTATGLSAGTYTIVVTDGSGCTISDVVTIINPLPTLTVTPTGANCYGDNSGSAVANAAGGTQPYTYLWNNGQTTSVATNLTAGNYTITVTDAGGCINITTTSIAEPAALVAGVGSEIDETCSGAGNGSGTISASGGTPSYSYSWNPGGQTTSSVSGLTSGQYIVTVTDGNGCTSTTTVTISAPQALAITPAQTNVTCSGGSNGTASVSVSGGTSPYTYLWNNGQTTATATGLGAGIYSVTVTDASGCTSMDVTTISNLGAPTVSVSTTSVTCNGGNTGNAFATVSGGNQPYIFLWSNGQTTSAVSNLVAGSYTLTTTDASGCIQLATLTVNEPAALLATIGTFNDVSCNGNSDGDAQATVSGGTPGYTYIWNNGQTTSAASNLAGGNYTVTVTDANGCPASATVTITEPILLSASVTPTNVSCAGGTDGDATAAVSGGTVPYSYVWNNGQTTSMATNLSAGNYTLTLTDANGCTSTQTVSISEPTALTSSITTTPSGCLVPTGTADAVISGGTPGYTYQWSNGESSANASGLAAGSYTLIITDANGCSLSDIASVSNVNPPSLNVSGNNALCNGGNSGTATAAVSGGSAPYTYWWNNGQTDLSATGLSAGTYTVVITDAAGCTQTDTISIAEPLAISVSATSAGSCNAYPNGSASATASGGTPSYSYAWNNGQTTSNATGLIPGSYTLSVTDANGCTSFVSVTVSSASVTASISGQTSICSGDVTILTASGGSAYSWSTGSSSSSITVSSSQTVAVVVSNGTCSDTAGFTVTVLAGPTANAGIDLTINQGSTTTLSGSGGGTYNWSPATGLTCISCSNPEANPTVTTAYTLIVTDANGCTSTDVMTVWVEAPDCNVVTYLPNAFSPNGDGENDEFQFYVSNVICVKSFNIRIYDRWGELVFESDDPGFKWDGSRNGTIMNTQVLVYYLDAVMIDNTSVSKKGNVSLMK